MRLVLLMFATLFLTACGQADLNPPFPANPTKLDPAAADGLPLPGSATVKQEPQTGVGAELALARLLHPAEIAARFDPTMEITGLGALTDGTWFSAGGEMPRVSARYTLPVDQASFLGALEATPQPARLTSWIAHPDALGYCYVNDCLSVLHGLDAFITSDRVTKQLSIPSAFGGDAGVIGVLQDNFNLTVEDDLSSWWDGEMLILWLRDRSDPPAQVYLLGVRDSQKAEDKVQQMLAMIDFYLKKERGVFERETLSNGISVEHLRRYGDETSSVDLGYILGRNAVAIGSGRALELLMNADQASPGSKHDPGFAWDASVLTHDPVTLALAFQGDENTSEIAGSFLNKAVGIMPGGGRDMAAQLGDAFAAPGTNRLFVKAVPGTFQWWLTGETAKDPDAVRLRWTGAQVLVVIGIANQRWWHGAEGSEDRLMTGDSTDEDDGSARPSRRTNHRPVWRDR